MVPGLTDQSSEWPLDSRVLRRQYLNPGDEEAIETANRGCHLNGSLQL